jgi:simple sugar transport system ATP-binding protein
VYDVADRIVVIDRGRIAGQFLTKNISLDSLMDKMIHVAETGKFEQ